MTETEQLQAARKDVARAETKCKATFDELYAAVDRMEQWWRAVDGPPQMSLLYYHPRVELPYALAAEEKADVWSGRIRRQLREWGWDVMAWESEEEGDRQRHQVELFSASLGCRTARFPGPTLLDCYIDALIWARERKDKTNE